MQTTSATPAVDAIDQLRSKIEDMDVESVVVEVRVRGDGFQAILWKDAQEARTRDFMNPPEDRSEQMWSKADIIEAAGDAGFKPESRAWTGWLFHTDNAVAMTFIAEG